MSALPFVGTQRSLAPVAAPSRGLWYNPAVAADLLRRPCGCDRQATTTRGESMRRLSVLPRRTRSAQLLALAGLALLALTLASSGLAVVHIEGRSTGLRDFDARTRVAPTKAQLQAARSIQGHVSWSTLGAPASVIRYGGYLATGIKAPSAAVAARSWLAAHKQLFQLRTVRHLRLATAAPLRGGRVHAVVFRQTSAASSRPTVSRPSPRDDQRRPHRAVHPEHGQPALEVVQLHRGRARLRGGAVQRA